MEVLLTEMINSVMDASKRLTVPSEVAGFNVNVVD